jgi:drug/metabolite transporter (DMT)-like permease
MKFKGILYSLGAALTWGLVYAFDERILTDLSPVTLLFIDAILTLVILIPVFLLHDHHGRELVNIPKRDWIFIIASLSLAVLANFFIYSGIKMLGADTASMIEIAYPLFVALFCFIIFRDFLTPWVAAGGLLMVVGAMMIIKLG